MPCISHILNHQRRISLLWDFSVLVCCYSSRILLLSQNANHCHLKNDLSYFYITYMYFILRLYLLFADENKMFEFLQYSVKVEFYVPVIML